MQRFTLLFALVGLCFASGLAQEASTSNAVAIPHFVRFSGLVRDADGQPLSGTVGVTFALYRDQEGGAPLWLETQNAATDNNGHYTVSLGATKADGLPVELFTSGEARWPGVQPEGQSEQPRVLLLSVPYALKAADAETGGGLPPSAFVLANGAQGSKAAKNPTVTGKGVLDFIPMWDSTSDIIDSLIFQKSSQIGINTTAPAAHSRRQRQE